MTLKALCGFDHATVQAAGPPGEWTAISAVGGVLAAAARYGINGFSCSSNVAAGCGADFAIGGTEATIIAGAAFFFRTFPSGAGISNARGLFSFLEGGTKHVDLRTDNSGKLMVSRNGTQIGSTGATTLSLNTWYYIEFKATIHDTTGSFEVRINEVVENMGTTTGLDTRNGGTGYIDHVIFGNDIQSLSNFWYGDDFYALDTQTVDPDQPNNTYLGDIAVRTLLPSGAGNTTQMTPSTGSNYACVDEAAPDTTDYVSETTTGEKDTYAMGDLPSAASSVKAVKGLIYMAKQDAGARTARLVVRSSGTDYESDSKTVSDSYAYGQYIWETDPATGGAWATSQPNNIEFGPKLQA